MRTNFTKRSNKRRSIRQTTKLVTPKEEVNVGCWIVTAGDSDKIHHDLTLRFDYTEEDLRHDRETGHQPGRIWLKIAQQAGIYSCNIADPGKISWVRTTYSWLQPSLHLRAFYGDDHKDSHVM
jgi:hypothetical protein